MGVPALFRWLSKKYPKIIQSVEEEYPTDVDNGDGTFSKRPVDTSGPNPNGEEYDNLYLDMNGIVHPCTHPEGKPAPETEEDMMLEVMAYTERVVAMIRPRRVLMMAIDGVAPRAKMNQQRSRRFRSAREAQEKEEARVDALEEMEREAKAAGREFDVEKWKEEGAKKAWDSNAITPGTPFMDLLASTLRYWVAKKLNTDPGWAHLQVIISDASVPGEGEHKIMDFIRRQRSHPESHDPNTKHVIYGLDADLIMLSLATHEPYFKVLREDVFAQDAQLKGKCRLCGQPGHIAANCKGEVKKKEEPAGAAASGDGKSILDAPLKPDLKPFIFLDVATLREYLEAELNLPGVPFGFDLERAIDDWIFLIFFVGNDFLPHLPSLEIREGAIDTLLAIWKRELPRMTSWLTNNGQVEMASAQLILSGVAAQEDDIFRRRKEQEDRQERNHKQRVARENAEAARNGNGNGNGGGGQKRGPSPPRAPAGKKRRVTEHDQMTLGDTEYIAIQGTKHKPLPQKPGSAAAAPAPQQPPIDLEQVKRDNVSAAQKIKAELAAMREKAKASAKPADKNGGEASEGAPPAAAAATAEETTSSDAAPADAAADSSAVFAMDEEAGDKAVDGEAATSRAARVASEAKDAAPASTEDAAAAAGEKDAAAAEDADADADAEGDEDAEGEDEDAEAEEEVEAEAEDAGNETVDPVLERKVNPDGTVEYVDTVKLWEPGYRERYYMQKFGIPLSDTQFRREVVKSYLEGLCWVLAYYYQGCPSWQWYYPYHFAPFAADMTDIEELDIKFNLGQPFKPFEQLMGVLPAASRASIPPAFHPLMTSDESEIIDFYPPEFQIDMNGKKMAWQGVALLPFIDQKRLLDALAGPYKELTDDEHRRNAFGNDVFFVGEQARVYDSICGLYAMQQKSAKDGDKPTRVALDASLTGGISGFVEPDSSCVPGSTFTSPFEDVKKHDEFGDIQSDRSISAFYYFPEQRTPHRSVLLKGLRMPSRKLNESDRIHARHGAAPRRGRGGGPGTTGPGRSYQGGQHMRWQADGGRSGDSSGTSTPYGSYGGGSYGGSYQGSPYGSYQQPPPQQQNFQGYGRQQNMPGYGMQQQPPQQGYGGYGGQGGYQQQQYNGYGGQGGYGGYGGQPQANPYGQQPPQQQYGNPYGAPPPQQQYGGQQGYANPYGAQHPQGYANPYGAPQQPQGPPQQAAYGGYGQAGGMPSYQPYAAAPLSYTPAAPPPQQPVSRGLPQPLGGAKPNPGGLPMPIGGRGGGQMGRGGGRGGRGR